MVLFFFSREGQFQSPWLRKWGKFNSNDIFWVVHKWQQKSKGICDWGVSQDKYDKGPQKSKHRFLSTKYFYKKRARFFIGHDFP